MPRPSKAGLALANLEPELTRAVSPEVWGILLELLVGWLEDRCEARAQHLHERASEDPRGSRWIVRMGLIRQLGFSGYREAGGRRLVEALVKQAASDDGVALIESAELDD